MIYETRYVNVRGHFWNGCVLEANLVLMIAHSFEVQNISTLAENDVLTNTVIAMFDFS